MEENDKKEFGNSDISYLHKQDTGTNAVPIHEVGLKNIVSLPCIFGQHNWVDTGNEIKIWSDNKTDSKPPEDCYTQKEQKCLLCGQIRSN